MAAQVVRISNEVEIPYLTYSGQPVLTFTLIDKAHNRVEGTASRNFRANRKRFIDGKDFYDLDSQGLDEFRRDNPGVIGGSAQHATLITEFGYLMLVKSFTDDLSWQIQRQLVDLYFRVKSLAKQPSPQPTLSAEQWEAIRKLVHWIAVNCHFHNSAEHAVYERIRFAHGLRNAKDLHPEHFDDAKSELEGLKVLAEQHRDRITTLDKEFIETVLRPPVSIRKVRAMAKRQTVQPPLVF